MTNLSPQAQAVLDAAFPAYDEENLYFLSGEQHTGKIVSAALREVINQLQQCSATQSVPAFISCPDLLELCEEIEKL